MPNYPNSDPTIDSLHTAVNNLATALNGAIDASQTTITVIDATGFPSVGAITIDAERISYTGKNATQFLGCTRAFGGTTADVHVNASQVKLTYGAEYHNDTRDEVIAMASDLRNGFEADLDDAVTPAATASSLKQRLDHFATAIKNIIGLADWKSSPTDTLDNLDSRLDTADSELAALRQNIPNIFVNGGLEVWQRGTSFNTPASGSYTADRWLIDFGGTVSGHTAIFSRESGAGNFESGSYSLKVDYQVKGSTISCSVLNYAPNAINYRGKTLTVKARVKSSISSGLQMNLRDGSSTISAVHTGSGWETLTATINVNSAASNIFVQFITTSIGIFYVDSVMLVAGDQAIDYVPEDPATELMRCQQFYETDPTSNERNLVMTLSGSNIPRIRSSRIRFATEKSATPTVTITKNAINLKQDAAVGSGSLSDTANWTLSASYVGKAGFNIDRERNSAQTGYSVMEANFTWEAEV